MKSSVLERPKEDEKCFGIVDKDGVEKMCVKYQPRTTTFNTEEEFKTGHEEEVNRLVSRTECERCPSTEPPKAGGKCPGLRCFKECVGPKQTLDKGYCTGVGICSNCNKAYNALKKKRDRSQREKLAEKNCSGKEFNHDAFAKKEANPLPRRRELHPYFIADYTCEMCDRPFVAKNQERLMKYKGEEGDVLDTLGDYLLLNNNTDKLEYRSKVYKGIKRGISSLFGRNDDEDGAQAPVCVCDDCCGRIGGTLAVAFRKHLVLDNEPEKLLEIGAESLKNVKLDNLRKNRLRWKSGVRGRTGTPRATNLRAWDSSDFVSGYYFPSRFSGTWTRSSSRSSSTRFAVTQPREILRCSTISARISPRRWRDCDIVRCRRSDSEDLVLPGSWVNGGVPFAMLHLSRHVFENGTNERRRSSPALRKTYERGR